MKYLQFASIPELLDHLEAENATPERSAQAGIEFVGPEAVRTVHLDLSEKHAPSGHGFSIIHIYAIVSQNCGDYLVIYGTLLHQIEDFQLRANDESAKRTRQKFYDETQERLDKVREEITSRAFIVKRGVWTGEAPTYLRRVL